MKQYKQDSIKSGSVITKNGALTIGLASLKHSVSVRKLGAVIELTSPGVGGGSDEILDGVTL